MGLSIHLGFLQSSACTRYQPCAARQVSSLVRKIAGFWDDITSLWEAKELPLDFWEGKPGSSKGVWLQRANNHRKYQEQFEIANYYRLGLDRSGRVPYVSSCPRRFWIIQKQWVAKGVACRDLRMDIRECTSTLAGWAMELRRRRAAEPRELPRELSSEPRRQVSLQDLINELALEDEQAQVAPQGRAQGAAGDGAGAAGVQPAGDTAITVGNGRAAHNP